jgi:hypothetical protein
MVGWTQSPAPPPSSEVRRWGWRWVITVLVFLVCPVTPLKPSEVPSGVTSLA